MIQVKLKINFKFYNYFILLDIVYLGTSTGSIVQYDKALGMLLNKIQVHTLQIYNMFCLENSNLLVSTSGDGNSSIINLAQGFNK